MLGALCIVAVLVAAFVLVRWAAVPAPAPAQRDASSSEQALTILAAIPVADLDRVGAGSAASSVVRISEPALAGPSGRPLVLYVGAEFCPYCAAERWPLIVALSRFGTFSGLRGAASSAADTFPSTPTFSFAGAAYTGQYVDLLAFEQDTEPRAALSAGQRELLQRYGRGGIPFIDFGNRAVVPGATYSPELLQGLTQYQVARALQDPTSEQARAILGSANLLTAAICLATEQRPVEVCASAGVRAASARLR